jgi:hypothetical protein
MPRVRIAPALPDRKTLDGEIARLRDLAVGGLRSHWHNVFGRRPHPHLPRHLLFRVLAYRLQADVLGDLDGESQRLLDRSVSPEDAGQRAVHLARRTADLRQGSVLGGISGTEKKASIRPPNHRSAVSETKRSYKKPANSGPLQPAMGILHKR